MIKRAYGYDVKVGDLVKIVHPYTLYYEEKGIIGPGLLLSSFSTFGELNRTPKTDAWKTLFSIGVIDMNVRHIEAISESR